MDQGVIGSLKTRYRMKIVQNMIEAIDSKKSPPATSLLDTMKMLILEWDEVTDKTVQNCFKKAGFSKIKDDDVVSDDPFAALKDSIIQPSIFDKTFEDVTAGDVTSFDMFVSTQEPLSNKDVLAGLLAVDIDEQHESDKGDSQRFLRF